MTFPIPQALPWRRALVAAAALGVAGCAFQSKAPEQDVQERAQARWDALVKRDFERAWTYTDPAFRARVPQADYKARFGAGGAWKEAKVTSVTCEPERCLVRVRVTTQNLEVVRTDVERGLIMVKGSVPGSKGGYVLVRDAVKSKLPEGVPTPGAVRGAGAAAAAQKEGA